MPSLSIHIISICILQGQLSRIAFIYIPWLGIVLENMHRLQSVHDNGKAEIKQNGTDRISTSSSFLANKDTVSNITTVGTPKSVHR